LATGLVAAVPVIVSAVNAVSWRWYPIGDRAEIVTRAYDVLSSHSPLLGQYSAASGVLGQGSYSLGPLLYWVLAVPARIGGYAPAIVLALVNVGCVMGAVALARRRGGNGLMVATAAAILLMSASLVNSTWSDVWNPSAALMPLLLLAFVAWSVGSGELRLLPLAVLLASFVVQCHLTYLVPALGLMVVAIAGVVVAQRREPAPHTRRWVALTLVVALVCWAAPIGEQLTHDPGNFVQVVRSAKGRQQTLGPKAGWHALAHTVGVPPWWLRPVPQPIERLSDVAATPKPATTATAAVVLAALLIALAVGARRRRDDVVVACAIALVLSLGVAVVAASTPSSGILFISVGYTLWWASIAGMFTWLVLGWSVLTLLRPAVVPRPLRYVVAAGALAGGLVVAIAAGPGPDQTRPLYKPMRAIAASLDKDALPGTPVAIERSTGGDPFDHRFDVTASAVYALRLHGARPSGPGLEQGFGSWYSPTRSDPPETVVRVACESAPGRVVGSVPEPPPCPVVVTVAPR
jgi:hypothetical protein